MKKILVVGGAGYIGGHLTDVLLNSGNDVSVLDSLLYEKQYLKNVDFYNIDIRAKQELKDHIEKNHYDIIIWLAALVGDGACAINEQITFSVNFDSLKYLLSYFKGKIIFTSTCSIYGKNENLIDENGEKNPQSIYAISKIECEKLLNNHDNVCIIRLGTLFGVSDLFSRLRLDLVVNILTLKASQNKTLEVFGGDQFRPLLHVKDVGQAVGFIVDNNILGTYNLSYKNFTIKEIAENIKNEFPSCKINYTDMQFEDKRNYRVKSDKFKKLGWSPKFDLKYGIIELKNIFLKKRIKNYEDRVFSNAEYLKTLNEFKENDIS